jgi:hypothetical protein
MMIISRLVTPSNLLFFEAIRDYYFGEPLESIEVETIGWIDPEEFGTSYSVTAEMAIGWADPDEFGEASAQIVEQQPIRGTRLKLSWVNPKSIITYKAVHDFYFGTPIPTQIGYAEGIESEEAFGTANYSLSYSAIGIESEEAFGTISVEWGTLTFYMTSGIASAERFGTARVLGEEVSWGPPVQIISW